MKINTPYDIGDKVYLVTDGDQTERIITSIQIYPNNLISYTLAYGMDESSHYEFEISAECDVKKKTSN